MVALLHLSLLSPPPDRAEAAMKPPTSSPRKAAASRPSYFSMNALIRRPNLHNRKPTSMNWKARLRLLAQRKQKNERPMTTAMKVISLKGMGCTTLTRQVYTRERHWNEAK